MNLPELFLARMKEKLGESFPDFLSAYQNPPVRGLRVNNLKIPREEFLRRFPYSLAPVPWEENGFYVQEEKLGAHPYHFAGLYYLQEPSAMCAAPLLGAAEGERVLDLCAAPGGKTTRLAQDMKGRGILVANEYDSVRARALSQNVERLGVTNCAVTNADSFRLAERFPAYFDKVLVDAPCSGEGMFKKEPLSVSGWSMENVIYCARRQAEILENAARMLRGGGTLVYSTCTFSIEENEGQIAAFLNRHSEFEAVQTHALYPHEVRGEGHFAAVLKKKAGECGSAKQFAVQTNKGAERAFADFAKDFFAEGKLPFLGTISTLADGRMYLIPEGMPDFGGIRVLRAGIELGEWDGKLFKPAHALAMCLNGGQAAKFVSLGIEQSETYLRGDTVECALANGWCVVGVEEFPLGMGKIVNGRVKNHLPKGLRKIK